MSTHAALGIRYPDNSIQGCYVHYDGGTIESRLMDFLEKNTTTGLAVLIAKAQATGGIRSFHCPPFEIDRSSPTLPAETDFLDDNEPYIIDENNWGDDHMGTSYRYLVDYETGKIGRL